MGNLRPDNFALLLLAAGLIMLFVPLMVMPGVVAILAAVLYWLTMIVLRSKKP